METEPSVSSTPPEQPAKVVAECPANDDMCIDDPQKFKELLSAPSPSEARPFALKKWNALAMWAWDVECDTCAICRVHLMDECLRCQAESASECVVVWGECNHSFHNCCMALWVRQNNRCPLCQQDWIVQRIGK